jgi:hypothetical protein
VDPAADVPLVAAALFEAVIQVREYRACARQEELFAGIVRLAVSRQLALERCVVIVATLKDYLTVGARWLLGVELLTLQLAARRAVSDRAGEGVTLNHLGGVANDLGQKVEAKRSYGQAPAQRR